MSFKSGHEFSQDKLSFFHKPIPQLIILMLLIISAFGIRLYHIYEPPLDFHPVRQYHSALIARGYYFEAAQAIPEWRKEVALINKQRRGMLEPQIMEYMAFLSYRFTGRENLWIPRSLSSLFWVIGGIFLYLIARNIASSGAALFSTAFYLFLPFGISASRSFQPDPMMVMMLLVSLFTIMRYNEQPSKSRLFAASAFSSLAIFIKPVCVFLIFGTFISLKIYGLGKKKSLFSSHSMIFVIVSLLPSIIYYVYGILNFPALKGQSSYSFQPHLLLSFSFWKGWLSMLGGTVGYGAVAGAIIGIFMFKNRLAKMMLMALWISYFIYGSVFTYHIHTHDYYHLQLVPVVALSLGPLGSLAIRHLIKRYWIAGIIIIIFIVFPIYLMGFHLEWKNMTTDVKSKLKIAGAVVGVNPQFIKFVNPDFKREVKTAKEIGKIVEHSTKTIVYALDNGNSLSYYGEVSAFRCSTDIAFEIQRLKKLRKLNSERPNKMYKWENIASEILKLGNGGVKSEENRPKTPIQYEKEIPEFFIVTDLEGFEKQKDLRDFLEKNFLTVVQNDDYIIFDLRENLNQKPENKI